MDLLGDLLAPYQHQIAKFAATVTCMQFLSGGFLLNDVRKCGTSDKFPVEPFLGGLVLTILSVKLGNVIGDANMVRVNLIGLTLNAAFTALFYWYASAGHRLKIQRKIGLAVAFVLLCFAYALIEHPGNLEFRFGILITSLLVVLIGSPLLHLRQIVAKRSTEGMPFPIILSGTIVTASWMLYGLAIKNHSIAFQNFFLFLLSGIQLSLFAIYPSSSSRPLKEKSSSSTSSSPAAKKKTN